MLTKYSKQQNQIRQDLLHCMAQSGSVWNLPTPVVPLSLKVSFLAVRTQPSRTQVTHISCVGRATPQVTDKARPPSLHGKQFAELACVLERSPWLAPRPDCERGIPRAAATGDALQSQPLRRPPTLKIGRAPEAHPAPYSQREGRRERR